MNVTDECEACAENACLQIKTNCKAKPKQNQLQNKTNSKPIQQQINSIPTQSEET